MISGIFSLFRAKKPDVQRALRAYRLHIGKSVYVDNGLELVWLEDDYEAMYGAYPVLEFHPHPALTGEQRLVSLKSEVRTHW